MHQRPRVPSPVVAAAVVALLTLAAASPTEATRIKSFSIDNALSSSLASKAGVDYVVAPGTEIVLRAIVSYFPGESPLTLEIDSTAGQLIPSRQIPPTPQAEVAYQAVVTVGSTNDEVELRLVARAGPASKRLRVIVSPPPPSGTFTIASPSPNQTIEPSYSNQTRTSQMYQWRVGYRTSGSVPRASYAEWCWRSLAANAGSLQNWTCAESRRGSTRYQKTFQFDNNSGNLSGTAFPGGQETTVRPCNLRGCGTKSPVRGYVLATEAPTIR